MATDVCNDATAATTAATKRCAKCLRCLPIEKFRKVWRDREQRQRTCNDCRNRLAREKTALRRERDAHKYAQRVNELVADQSVNALMRLTEEMIARFRGFDNFVNEWQNAIQRATEAGKHHLAIRSMLAIFNLSVACATIRDKGPTPSELTDADLQRQLDAVARRLLDN